MVGAFDYDIGAYYTPGEVGIFVFADQAVFSDLTVSPLTGPGAVTKFCNGHGRCNPVNGLCDDMQLGGNSGRASGSSSSSDDDDDQGDAGTLTGVIIGLLIFAFGVGAVGYYYGAKQHGTAGPYKSFSVNSSMEMTIDSPMTNEYSSPPSS